MMTPTLPNATLGHLYSQAQELTAFAPLSAPSIGLDHSGRKTGAVFNLPRSTRLSQFDKEFETGKKTDGAKRPKATPVKPVDPLIFDILVSNEYNRQLKKNFGIAFVGITCAFTVVSYGIIVLSAVYEWKLPTAAITALVVQAPLQMIGILYIMAKNLFPTIAVHEKQGQ